MPPDFGGGEDAEDERNVSSDESLLQWKVITLNLTPLARLPPSGSAQGSARWHTGARQAGRQPTSSSPSSAASGNVGPR